MMSFAIAEATVRHGDLAGEAGGNAAQRLRGERDFRDEEERLPSLRQREFDGAQVDFGLATAGHAVQQEAAPGGFADLWPAAQFCLDLLPDGLLPWGERRRRVGHEVARDASVVPALGLAQVYQAQFFEALQLVTRDAGFRPQLRQRHGRVGAGEQTQGPQRTLRLAQGDEPVLERIGSDGADDPFALLVRDALQQALLLRPAQG